MKRKIIEIDEEKCTGCGICIPECKEGALQVIEGKARLISDLFCDGLGACIGHCPEDAIRVVEKEAEAYNEEKVIESLANKPAAVLAAHLSHLKSHNETDLLNQALKKMNELGIKNPLHESHDEHSHHHHHAGGSCPGSMMIDRRNSNAPVQTTSNANHPHQESQLKQWPVQLHLVSPLATYFKNAELIVMSTCSPIAFADIQNKYIKDHALVVACPKLDHTEPYTQKLADIFSNAGTTKVIILIMEVPCCKGLTKITTEARNIAERNDMPIEEHTISLEGKLLSIKFL